MTTTSDRLTREQIRETLQALDRHAVDSIQARLDGRPAPSPDTLPALAREAFDRAQSGINDDYSDLPDNVLYIFDNDKLYNKEQISQNGKNKVYDIDYYKIGTITKEQLEEQLKERDKEAIEGLKKTLEQSRLKLEKELETLDRETQDHAHGGRAAETTRLNNDWSGIVASTEKQIEQTEQEISGWFDDVVTALTTFFRNVFGL
ncbi:hypothetical protein ACIOML_28610 [Streptomyces anulatus]